jgi:CheY-like chemotaxis protein
MGRAVREPRILVVEDEILIALWIGRIVEARGWVPLPVTTVDGALAQLRAGRFDGALLDINLHGLSVEPVMDVLYDRGIPFAVVTVRVPPQLQGRLDNVIVIDKPCSKFEIEYALDSLFSETPPDGQDGGEGDGASPDGVGPAGPPAAARRAREKPRPRPRLLRPRQRHPAWSRWGPGLPLSNQ